MPSSGLCPHDGEAPVAPGAEDPEGPSLRIVGLLGVRSSLPVTEIAVAAENEGGQLARSRPDGYLLLFAQRSAEAAVEAAFRVGSSLLARLAPSDLLVLHAAPLWVWERGRGLNAIGVPLDAPASWWPPEKGRAGVVTTPAASGVIDGRTLAATVEGPGATSLADAPPPAPPMPLVGRDHLLAMMLAEAQRAFAAVAPVMTTLVGEVGYGKTRLLEALAERLIGRARVVRVQFRSPAATDIESSAVILGRAAGADEIVLRSAAAGEATAKKIAAALRPAAGDPTVFLIDDAHWADPSALDALELAAMEGGAPLSLVTAATPELLERRPRWGERALDHVCHRLPPLDPEAERTLLRGLLQPAEFIPGDILSELQEMARGVPLFAAEIAHALRAGGAFRRAAGTGGWYVAGDDLLRVSSTPLAARLARRLLGRLPWALRGFAELCAVLGGRFSRAQAIATARAVIAASALPYEPRDPEAALDRLIREGVLHAAAGGYCQFRHPMLGAAIEDGIPAGRRRQLHRIALNELTSRPEGGVSAAMIARHAERCGADEEAFTHHFALAEEARAKHHHQAADERYTAALRHLGDRDPRRIMVLGARARVRSRQQRFADALADLHASRPQAEARGDHRALADLLLEEATIHDWRESWGTAAPLVAWAGRLVERCGDPGLRARWLMAVGRTCVRDGRVEEAIRQLTAGRAAAAEVADHETWAIASMLLGTALVAAGRIDEAEQCFAAVIDSCQRAGDTLHLCSAYNNRMWLWFKRESLEAAIADQRQAAALAREIAHAQLERSCTYNLAELLYWRGDLTDALELARRARELQTRFLDEVPLDALLVARISAARGDLPMARRELEWVLAHCTLERPAPLVQTQMRLVELLVAGACSDAAGRWQALVEEARATSVMYELHEIVHFAAATALREQRLEEARRYLEQGTSLAGSSGVWRDRFSALRASMNGSI